MGYAVVVLIRVKMFSMSPFKCSGVRFLRRLYQGWILIIHILMMRKDSVISELSGVATAMSALRRPLQMEHDTSSPSNKAVAEIHAYATIHNANEMRAIRRISTADECATLSR